MDELVLQSIIGTDKKNPFLHVCRRRDSNQLDVFYGAQHLETVVDNKEHISYPILIPSTIQECESC